MTVDRSADRALLAVEYATPRPLLDRVSIYRYALRPVDILGAVCRHVPELETGARVLDVGCGPGRYLDWLGRHRPEVALIGSDLSPGMAAASAPFAPTLVADAQRLPFASGSFAAVLAAHMLYHVPDIGLGASELARVCRPAGTVLVVTNGSGHLRELRELMAATVTDLAGQSINFSGGSGARFSLEHAPDLLAPHLRVVAGERWFTTLEVPMVEPVATYVDSLRVFYESELPVSWEAFAGAVRRRVEGQLAAEGAWRATTDAGMLICSPVQ